MTQDEIIEMARQVCDIDTDKRGRHTFVCDEYGLEAFAKLVAEHEREACAELCEMLDVVNPKNKSWDEGTIDCATAIRARGQA